MYLYKTIPLEFIPNSQISVRRKESWEVCGLGLQVLQYCKTYSTLGDLFFNILDSDEVDIYRLGNRCLKTSQRIFFCLKTILVIISQVARVYLLIY